MIIAILTSIMQVAISLTMATMDHCHILAGGTVSNNRSSSPLGFFVNGNDYKFFTLFELHPMSNIMTWLFK